MSKRMLLCAGLLLVLVSLRLPFSKAQSIPTRSSFIPISTYRDDPFVAPSTIEQMVAAKFGLAEEGRRILSGELVTISEVSKIYRRDETNTFKPFAWNPWPAVITANEQGDFRIPDEARFPLFKPERGLDGKIVLKDGLQVWLPLYQRLGDSTAFVTAHTTKAAAESWAGRALMWGVNGVLDIEPHVFQAEQLRLDQRGVPLSLVRQPRGQWTVEARVLRGQGLNTYLEVFTLDKPQGERREILIPPVPPEKQLQIANDLLK